jgi:hypothetical protein
MANITSSVSPIEIVPGVLPSTDASNFANFNLYTAAQGIRFENNKPKKIGGWLSIAFEDAATIDGVSRSIFSTRFSNRIQVAIGTNEHLYNLSGSQLTNITPLLTTTTPAANSLATHYATLGNNPFTTVNGSNVITVTDSEYDRFKVGDTVTYSGTVGFAGIPAGNFNTSLVIRSIGAGTYTVRVATPATSSTSGGGASVVRSSGLITVTSASHGQLDGARVKITGAADTGGILAASIIQEFIIRNVVAGAFDVMTPGTATSSVSSSGGASTVYAKEIPSGSVNESFGQGYGMGLYGAGLYGVPKTSTSGRVFPRAWFFDRFGDLMVMTPGEQTGVYQWDGSTAVAPTLISGAPTEVNYAFVSNNILVTFGASGFPNKIKTSDQGDITTWTASSTNAVFEDDIEGADRLISHLQVNGVNLIFTENQTYVFNYIGLPNVWQINQLDNGVGIAGPMARVTVNGVGYWMGLDNFYMWAGGNIEPIPSNIGPKSTILNYVFDDFNKQQKTKCFAWHNKRFNEIWFHYPSADSEEPNRIARYHVLDRTWAPDVMDRTAAEYPAINLINPLLISSGSTLYKHEVGTDNDQAALPWSITGPLSNKGQRDAALITRLLPDSVQSGNVTVNLKTYQKPNSQAVSQDKTYTVTDTTDKVACLARGRFWRYQWSGEALGQEWQMGNWQEELQTAGKI